jgi:hypothetical protein
LNRLALICIILSGCSQISPYHQALKDAEKIIEDKPDSALRILEQMATAPITNDEDVALYCLPPQTITPFLSLSPARGMFRFGDMMSDVSFHFSL